MVNPGETFVVIASATIKNDEIFYLSVHPNPPNGSARLPLIQQVERPASQFKLGVGRRDAEKRDEGRH
jgi:hypothetical protein